MKHKSESFHVSKLVKYVLIGLVVFLGLICLYCGSLRAPGLRRADDGATADGVDPLFGGYVHDDSDFDDSFEDQERNPEIPKSIPVCFALHFSYIDFLFLNRVI